MRHILAFCAIMYACVSQAQNMNGVTGSSIAIMDQNAVSRGNNGLGEFDGSVALMSTGAYITLDLGAMLTTGDEITFRIGNYFFPGQAHVQVSADGDDFSTAFVLDGVLNAIPSWRTLADAEFTVSGNTFRYIKIHALSGLMMLDGVTYNSLSGDVDGDGVNNDMDCKMWDPAFGADRDLDGICDETDMDIDNDGILNTQEQSCTTISPASAQSVFTEVSISGDGAAQALSSNNRYAVINKSNDLLVLDMGRTIPAETEIQIEARITKKFHVMGVQTSTDGITYSAQRLFTWTALNTDVEHSFMLTDQARYVKIYMAVDNGSGDIQIDDVRHRSFSVCVDRDTDGDGISDQFDLDSDNDGCFDVLEAGFADQDNNGMLDGTGVSALGLITGAINGYSGTQAAVTTTAFGECMMNVNAGTHLVNIAQDLSDANIGDGICADVNGNCTLRAAIQEANSGSGLDFIGFEVAGQINLTTPLPIITQSVIIDGSTAPGYVTGSPSVQIRGNGFNLFHFSEVNQVQVKGLDLSGSNSASFDSYALVAAWCTQLEVMDNVIHNRLRAVHFNNSCDITITGNDLRDSGAESWDAAVYLINLCPGSTAPTLDVRDNTFGRINTLAKSAVQVVNTHNIITSDGSVAGTHIALGQTGSLDFPIRYVNVQGGRIANLDLSSALNQNGIGLRLLNSSNIIMDNLKIKERAVALQITGGNDFEVSSCDFSSSGLNQDYSSVLIENVHVQQQDNLKFSDNIWEENAATVVNLIGCSGIGIQDDISTAGNIEITQTLRGRAPVRIQSSADCSVLGLNLVHNGTVTNSKGIYVQGNSSNITIEENYLEGWKTGISIESASQVNVACNTLALNSNGMFIHGSSQVANCTQNSYRCNAVAIYNRSNIPMISQEDYWGDASGSSSYSGFGDYYIGQVNASAWADTIPSCVQPYEGTSCITEICDNGIDDDGDGVIDCADNSCIGNLLCAEPVVIESQSDVTQEKLNDTSLNFSMYPNPSSGRVNIQLEGQIEFIRIFDIKGQLIHTERYPRGNVSIDLSHVQAGMYQVEVSSELGIEHKTLIIE